MPRYCRCNVNAAIEEWSRSTSEVKMRMPCHNTSGMTVTPPSPLIPNVRSYSVFSRMIACLKPHRKQTLGFRVVTCDAA